MLDDDNALACGARTNNKPLTDLGIEAIQAMNHIGIAIDTSHCCEWNSMISQEQVQSPSSHLTVM